MKKAQSKSIYEIACRMRNIFEESSRNGNDPFSFSSFPNGACGPTSELIGRYFREVLETDAMYIGASRSDDDWTHAWITVNDLIVDITADQFDQKTVIVEKNSPWHDKWDAECPRPPICNHKQWPAYPFQTWSTLCTEMKKIEQ